MNDDMPLWGMSRRTDPQTSRAAALAILPGLNELQRRVLEAYADLGAMTAKECEALPRFRDLGFSTVRKRASELVKVGALEATDEKRDRCYVLRVKGGR